MNPVLALLRQAEYFGIELSALQKAILEAS